MVQRWCKYKVKPHSRYLEWGFRVTPTGFIQCNTIKQHQNHTTLYINDLQRVNVATNLIHIALNLVLVVQFY